MRADNETEVHCSRREFILAASALAVPLVAGCSPALPAARTSGLVLGISDALCKQTASECVGEYGVREYAGLAGAVRSEIGLRLRFKYFRSDQRLETALRRGELDGVICKAWTALRCAAAAGRQLERLADIPGPTGAEVLRGVFIARKDSPLMRLEDIQGRLFAQGTDADYESSFQARETLSLAGVRPGESVTLASCLNVAALVWERQVDAGVVSDYCVDHSGLQLVGDPEAFRIIGRTAGVPFITFAVSREIPLVLRSQLKACLLKLAGSTVPEDLHTTGMIAPIAWKPAELREV